MQRRYIHVNPDQSLSIATEQLPPLEADEVLVKVHGIGINRGDLLQRQGLYPPPKEASPIMGLEVSGEIIGVGNNAGAARAGSWKIGDMVCALTQGAGYCDFTIVPASQCLPIPAMIDVVSAAALPEAVFTVWHNVFQRCQLKAGETFLVHGGASGIGTMAIQMALAFGATVYATAGDDNKCKVCEQLGATKAINYQTQDFEQESRALSPKGIDVILDMAGGDFIPKNINLAAEDGRIVSIALVRGAKAEINFALVMMKRLTLTGSTLRAQSLARKVQMAKEIREQVWPLIKQGKIKPVIDRMFAFTEVEQAHQRMASGEHSGKILLRVL
jgi:putative PIG3 family NAD(P)H quinone oxidoreductase